MGIIAGGCACAWVLGGITGCSGTMGVEVTGGVGIVRIKGAGPGVLRRIGGCGVGVVVGVWGSWMVGINCGNGLG